MKKVMNFSQFLRYLESKESEKERLEIEAFFEKERKEKRILTFDEFNALGLKRFVFLTYDLINVRGYPGRYTPINNYLRNNLQFYRDINGQRLTNNSFASFINPINRQILLNLENQLINFFGNHLPDFRIYMNIADIDEYTMHP